VNVFDHAKERGWVYDVAVVAATSLPEAVMDFTVGLDVLQPVEKAWSTPLHKLQSLPLHRDFQSRADKLHFVFFLLRPDYEVNMFRHDNVCQDGKIKLLPCLFHGIDKPSATAIPAQQGETTKAGERQFVGIARLVVALDTFSVKHK
jgi:hypothetical protein